MYVLSRRNTEERDTEDSMYAHMCVKSPFKSKTTLTKATRHRQGQRDDSDEDEREKRRNIKSG